MSLSDKIWANKHGVGYGLEVEDVKAFIKELKEIGITSDLVKDGEKLDRIHVITSYQIDELAGEKLI